MPIAQSTMYNDAYADYYAVMEQTTPEDSDVQILKHSEGALNFLRFRTCLQSFYGRNRNRRLWKASQIKTMANAEHVQELIRNGSFVGEAGHPTAVSGKLTLERICTIDPLRCSHRITALEWQGESLLYGTVETLDEGPGTPGRRFMNNILQGVNPAFSLRSLVPQRKNADGSIDVLGPGRMICYDRVYLPSHKEAYRDESIPVKEIVSKPKFEVVMESFTDYMMSHSDKINRVLDGLDPAMESVAYDPNSQMVSVKTDAGRLFVAPELKYRKELSNLMSGF